MISVNGKIPAGSVSINATDKQITEKRSPLEKCPDKNAEVIYTQSYELVEIIKKISPPRLSISVTPSSSGG